LIVFTKVGSTGTWYWPWKKETKRWYLFRNIFERHV